MGENTGEPEKTIRGGFNIYADLALRDTLKELKAAGHVFNGKPISYGLAFELGARIITGMAEGDGDEMVLLQQKAQELEAEEAALIQKRKMLVEQTERVKLRQVANEAEKEREWDDVRVLAARIVELWDKIILEHRWNLIDSLVAISPERLNSDEIRAVFPVSTYQPAPDPSRAFQIAAGLLHYENVSGGIVEA